MSQCCISGFAWNGKPQGREEKLGKHNTYVAGSADSGVAILFLHDIFGWKFGNNRLLADHFAKEVGATVYLPDFFDGEVVEEDTIATPEKQANFDFAAWFGRNNKDIRGPEVFEAARILKQELGFQKVGAIGYCWGGWAAFQVGAKGRNLVDCISVAHPTFLLPEEIDAIDVPVQIIAPENDMMFKPELKAYANKKIPELNIGYDYQYFPNLSHGFATRGDPNNMTQKAGLERAKNAAVTWFATWLKL
ncbi:MAG: hypothetical protein LQ346_005335 [Caloplaca aetnensis]|nr:MAG: hypothetical protein LQ346_005335 [Caloplaca aetnensis]